MADIFFVQSDRPEVIVEACSTVRTRLSKLAPGSLVDRFDGTGWALLMSRNPVVPHDVSHDDRGIAVIIGSTYDPRGPQISGLRQAAPEARVQAMREYCRGLNFGMALSVQNGEVLAVSDWLGLYPIYLFQSDTAFVVASVPGLVRSVKGCQPGVDLHGLVALLLLAHTCLEHTLYKDVSRLRSGSMLRYRTGDRRMTLEDVQLENLVPGPADLDEAIDAFDMDLKATVGEAARQGVRTIYLSGGLDSRILAGYLHEAEAGPLTAVTAGDRRDLEMRAAARVASRVGAAHEMIQVDQSRYTLDAQRSIDHDGLTSGLYVLAEWTVSDKLRHPILTGFLGDPVMGAGHVDLSREPSCDIHTFHALFTNLNASGLSPGLVRELVRVDGINDIILDVQEQLRKKYYSIPGEPWQKTLLFNLLHRQRLLIGRLPKILALGSWPILPYAQSSVVRLSLATPFRILSDRKIQIELIQRKFPALALLPLARGIDRRWYTLGDGQASAWTRATERVKDSLSWRLHKRFNLPERRVFVRTFDFDGVGWRALRDQARASVECLDALFNRDMVLQLIPPSSVSTRFKRLITDATGRKALVGAVLFCKQIMENSECK